MRLIQLQKASAAMNAEFSSKNDPMLESSPMKNSGLSHKSEPKQKIRVLHFIHAFSFGGAHIKVLNLLKEIDATKFSVDIALPASDAVDKSRFSKLQEKGIDIKTIKLEGSSDLLGMIRLYRLIKTGNYQIVHIHQAKFGGTLGRIAARLAFYPKIVVEEAGLAPAHYWITNRLHRFLHLHVVHPIWNAFFLHRLIAVSDAVATSAIAREEIGRHRICVIHNGIDVTKFNGSDKSFHEWRRVLSVPEESFLVAFVGRFGPEKGISFLLKGFSEAVRHVKNLHLILVGDGPLKEQLRHEISSQNLLKSVTMIGWSDDVASLLKTVDLLVLPSLNEAFGLVLLEAMAAGVPVIGTSVGGIPEVIHHGKTGLLVPPGSPEAIATSIVWIHENPEAVQRMITQARDMVNDRFTSKAMARSIEKVYLELLNRT
jgi:glycosyltransferase involved in cell wall biosynthesis